MVNFRFPDLVYVAGDAFICVSAGQRSDHNKGFFLSITESFHNFQFDRIIGEKIQLQQQVVLEKSFQ
jgi:hypothetical protein